MRSLMTHTVLLLLLRFLLLLYSYFYSSNLELLLLPDHFYHSSGLPTTPTPPPTAKGEPGSTGLRSDETEGEEGGGDGNNGRYKKEGRAREIIMISSYSDYIGPFWFGGVHFERVRGHHYDTKIRFASKRRPGIML